MFGKICNGCTRVLTLLGLCKWPGGKKMLVGGGGGLSMSVS